MGTASSILLGELSTVWFSEPMLHADSHVFSLFVLRYNMGISVKNTASILQGIAPCLYLHALNGSAFWTIQEGSVMAKLPFLFFRELVNVLMNKGFGVFI